MKTIQENRKQVKSILKRFKRYAYETENAIHYNERVKYDNCLLDTVNSKINEKKVMEVYK